MYDFLFLVTTEDSENCGEHFFVECEDLDTAWKIASNTWIDEELKYLGEYSVDEAEEIGFDTY